MEIEHYIVENLTNLDTIPNPIFEFLIFPIKLRGATAAPVRAVAIVEDD
jgi:kynurenine formamidase